MASATACGKLLVACWAAASASGRGRADHSGDSRAPAAACPPCARASPRRTRPRSTASGRCAASAPPGRPSGVRDPPPTRAASSAFCFAESSRGGPDERRFSSRAIPRRCSDEPSRAASGDRCRRSPPRSCDRPPPAPARSPHPPRRSRRLRLPDAERISAAVISHRVIAILLPSSPLLLPRQEVSSDSTSRDPTESNDKAVGMRRSSASLLSESHTLWVRAEKLPKSMRPPPEAHVSISTPGCATRRRSISSQAPRVWAASASAGCGCDPTSE